MGGTLRLCASSGQLIFLRRVLRVKYVVSRHLLRCFLCLTFLWGISALAGTVLELVVKEELEVLSEPRSGALVIARLGPGDNVVTSARLYQAFRKVLVIADGKPKAGYVLLTSIKQSPVRERDVSTVPAGKGYAGRIGLGAAIVGSYLRQGKGQFELPDGTEYQLSVFESKSFFLSVFADFPINERWAARASVVLRQTHFRGSAEQLNTGNPNNTHTIERDQQLLGMGIAVKRYLNRSRYWLGGGVEMGQGTNVTIKIDGQDAPTSDRDLPFFAICFLGTGGDWKLFGPVYLVPDFRVGVIGTIRPPALYVEGLVGLAYRF
jgi:hypothetical protein